MQKRTYYNSKIILFWFIATVLFLVFPACDSKHPLEEILASTDPKIQQLLKKEEQYGIQILYTQINASNPLEPKFTRWAYGLDEEKYFYPASTVKLPIVLLALEKINSLKASGIPIDKTTPFHVYDPKHGRAIQKVDSTHAKKQLTVAHLIKRVFLISDNAAYNLLFDFLGKDYINKQLEIKGLHNTQIHHKFLFGADNTNTWEYVFTKDRDTIYHQKSLKASYTRNNGHLKNIRSGKGYISEGRLISQPMDFSLKNRVSMLDLEGLLLRVIFPESFPKEDRFNLSEEDYSFIRHWMSRTPFESKFPNYADNPEYYDSYVKFLVYGDTPGKMDGSIRIYNKVGDAYGTLTDTAYISIPDEDISFFLTATVYVNNNQIFNDDIYEYDRLGFPFLGALGRAVVAYERKQKR